MIVAEARCLRVDAIVMSRHGHSGLGRWLFGSVALRVLEAASCPVVLIHSNNLQPLIEEGTTEVPALEP